MFNKDYRYNYKFNNSPVVTNVLFADTVKQVGNDTVYAMNRIGIQCTVNCQYDTNQFLQHPFYDGNMPQFLQRNLIKHSNGTVVFYDTTKMVIIPGCVVNQTWLFDSILNLSATCIATGTQAIFGTIDSVKTILISNTDSLKISKSFGIVLFPEPYFKNKYYRLSGIEKKISYDQTALFGEKVSNAWDFYDLNIGDMFCRVISSSWLTNMAVKIEKNIITGKTPIQDGYQYTSTNYFYELSNSLGGGMVCTWIPIPSYTLTTKTYSYTNLSSPILLENKIYPGMIYVPSTPTPTFLTAEYNSPFQLMQLQDPNIAYFGLDNNGKFYKNMGNPCISYTNPVVPNPNSPNGLEKVSNSYYKKGGYHARFLVGNGFGLVSLATFHFESTFVNNLTSFVKNGITYFGPPNTLGIKNYDLENKSFRAYPNPAHSTLNLNITERSTVRLFNSLGKEIHKSIIDPGNTIDTGSFPAGIYVLLIETIQGSSIQKLVIEH